MMKPANCHNRNSVLLATCRHILAGLLGCLLLASTLGAQNTPTRSILDPIGRSLQVPLRPQRIIALAPNITEILFDLDLQPQLVGVTRFSDYPPAARNLPKVGSYVRLDLERIVQLRPDLCVGIKDGNPRVVVERLDQMGIPVFAVDPRDLKSLMQAILAMGDLTGKSKRAQAIVGNMRERIENIKAQAALATFRPRVFFQIGIAPIVSVGSDTFIHELITLAGGQNTAAGNTPYPRFNQEQVIALAPDVIIITSMARKAVFEEVRTRWQRWPSIPAVRNEAIYLEQSNLFDRPTPRLVEGLELLFQILQEVRHASQP